MARNLRQATAGDAEAPAGIGHNATEIKRVVSEVSDSLIRIDAAMETHRAEAREARARLKTIGMKQADFNAMHRVRKLEDNERAEAITSMQIAFEALGLGGQGDLFPDAAAAAKRRAGR